MADEDFDLDLDDDTDDGVDDDTDLAEPASQSERLEQRIRDEMAKPEYADAGVPGHRAQVELVHRLFEKRAEGRIDPMQKMVAEVQAEQAATQDKLRAEAEKELDALEELGFRHDHDELPEKVEAYHIRGLQEQRLLAEQKFDQVAPMLEQDLHDLKASADVSEAFRIFINAADVDADVRDTIADTVIRWIYKANTQKFGVKK